MLKLNQEAKEFLETKLNDKEVLIYVSENCVLPAEQTKTLEGLIPELKANSLYDVLVSIAETSFSVRFLCTDDTDIETVEIPKGIKLIQDSDFNDETMQKFSFEMAWMAVKAFENDIPICTREGEDSFTRITTAPDVLRYLHRLYVQKNAILNINTICGN